MDLQKTQHFTTRANQICNGLVDFIPANVKLVEPFVGEGDLLSLFPNHQWEKYDIDPRCEDVIKQDTLTVPPSYAEKWVITNPPYLAKNKAKDGKKIFDQYKVDDLYKAAMLSILDAEGGILIIPSNFFTDERTGAVRKSFLSTFDIYAINFFTSPVFESTTYSVCSFAFGRKKAHTTTQSVLANIYPEQEHQILVLEEKYDYRVAGEFYHALKLEPVKFERLTTAPIGNKYILNLKLFALDTRTERIRLEYCTEHFVGKATDRSYATLVSEIPYTEEQQKYIANEFNKQLEDFRRAFGNLSLTNYRDYNRKRIGFVMAYQLASKVAREMMESEDV